ncbi:unnamed protein product [Hydatigera taeniaeformis]|uniref:Uncharacterized protein n=1 Tax=Hydatigena taeniaeformis TaxID=6205 RepID=A0A0R3WIL4_HYDTA|nr:unnamed protein product [Hydatigera taeniaeformis]
MWLRLLVFIVLIHLVPTVPYQLDLKKNQMEEEWMDALRGESKSLPLNGGAQWHPEYQARPAKEPHTSATTFLKRIRRILADY